jgi:hypothetical protein
MILHLIRKIFSDVFVTFLGLSTAITILFSGDYLASRFMLTELNESDRPFLKLDKGWYELKSSFSGEDIFGKRKFLVETTKYGFRKEIKSSEPQQYDFLFLGDSFTYGVNGPWNETFVGMFSDSTNFKVLNGGVPSYSPTPYIYRYKKALGANLLNVNHKTIVALDISDVQDEAGYWIDGSIHPEKRVAELEYRKNTALQSNREESFLRKHFPNMASLYSFIKYDLLSKYFGRDSEMLDHPRSGFTYMDWNELDRNLPYKNPAGYKPLGVRNGLDKVRVKLKELNDLVETSGGNMYILIYPWPSQLTHEDKFSFEKFVNNTCLEISCSGVINTFDTFRKIAATDSDWVKNYFHTWDIHFNQSGNKVIADSLVDFFDKN